MHNETSFSYVLSFETIGYIAIGFPKQAVIITFGRLKLRFQRITLKQSLDLIEQIGAIFAPHPATNGFTISDLNNKVASNEFFVISDKDGGIVAAASACIDETDCRIFKIINFMVSQQYRGLGIGRWFLRCVEAEALKTLESYQKMQGDRYSAR